MLRVTTASESAARDHAAIAGGAESFTLMLNAGTRAAEVVLRDFPHALAHGVTVFAGPGNNGGDAYILAAQLVRAGIRARVVAVAPPKTDDAMRAASVAQQHGVDVTSVVDADNSVRLCVDGMLGTGHQGPLRGNVAQAAAAIAALRLRGASIVALDVPSGLNATSGERSTGAVVADVTVTFGTIKRGLLINRASAGRILLVDINLGAHANGKDDAWKLATTTSLAAAIPGEPWNAHKGSRGHLSIVGGTSGMAGAIILASRAALCSGIGLVRTWVDEPGVSALQLSVPQAITQRWSDTFNESWGTALAIGPGLGRTATSLRVLQQALEHEALLPAVIDADALTLMAANDMVEQCGASRPMVLTPHAGEFARLTGHPTPHNWQQRADALRGLAVRTRATILLKGTPTLIASPDGGPIVVVPRGTAVLAAGGSGDMLTGIIGTLLAQGATPLDAAIVGATAHGRAAELAGERARHGARHDHKRVCSMRGITLENVLNTLPHVWRDLVQPASFPPGVIAEMPAAQGTL